MSKTLDWIYEQIKNVGYLGFCYVTETKEIIEAANADADEIEALKKEIARLKEGGE